MIYLDNAATSYPKPERVYNEIDRCMREYCANPGRGGHFMSIAAGKAVEKVRDIACRFFNLSSPLQICFTKNATEALNMAIKGCLKPGDHVITTGMEHNSVMRPLKTLEKYAGIELTVIRGDEYGEVDVQDVGRSIKRNTRLIVCTISSNVNGIVMPVKEMGKLAQENGILFLVDASQGAGTLQIDAKEMRADMLAFPGHKGLLGPQGSGGLYVRESLNLTPILQGGTGSNSDNLFQPEFMPDSLESGTLNTPGIVGMGCGMEFINSFGLENLRIYKHFLLKRLHEGIKEIKCAKLYNKSDMGKNTGIVAMNFEGVDSTEISYILDKEYGIATRAGLHCAPMAHQVLGTSKTGLVRFSIGCFNTIEEIEKTLDALRKLSFKVKNLKYS